MREQWRLSVLVSGSGRCHRVGMHTVGPSHSKWLIRARNLHQILCLAWTFLCGNYSDDLGATAMGSWWWATSSQRACSCITSHAEFFGETSNHPGDSATLQPRFGVLQLLPFPKTKITFEREEISDHRWDSGKYDGAADGNWENCVRSQGAFSF